MQHRKKRMHRAIAWALAAALGLSCFGGLPAVAADTSVSAAEGQVTGGEAAVIREDGDSWTLENQAVRLGLAFTDGSLRMTSFYNKAAEREYLTADDETNYLFSYDWAGYENGSGAVEASKQTVSSADGKWEMVGSPTVEDVTTRNYDLDTLELGQSLEIVLQHATAGMQVTLQFEIYNGVGGIHYQTFIKNTGAEKMVITESDVISLNMPNDAHYLHYINARSSSSGGAENATWKTTTGSLNFENKAGNLNGRNALCVYESGDGWWMMPETNWRTQIGPENYGDTPSKTNTNPEFASISCWDTDSTQQVMVRTHPESVQLTLKPDEEYQYIGVNLTAFKGDVVDGKMAAEEHFRLRYKYHDTTTILNTNDWDYNSKSTFEYMRDVIIPQAVKANVDMVMIDDLWNVNRDSIEAVPKFKSLSELGQMIRDNGKMFGIWYSLTGDGHNKGRDLADPDQWYGNEEEGITGKKELIETLINEYKMDHQMIDLTEFWQNTQETDYSSPCDNVYRKNTNVNNWLNELVAEYPNYLVKLTNEVDVYPTQGNRATGLLHMTDNGWVVHNAGLSGGMAAMVNSFGYLPLNSTYTSGAVDGTMNQYYHYMFARNVKLNTDPGGPTWTDHGVQLMATFNDWRKGARIKELTDNVVTRPCYLGEDWDSNDGANWISNGVNGPYAWMYTDADRSRALMLATSYNGNSSVQFTADTRWLDADKNYLVADVTLDDTGSFTYAYKGLYSGAQLTEEGFLVDLSESTSGGKAYWFEAVGEDTMQVVYADEKIETYESSVSGDVMTVKVTGQPDTMGTVIVANSAENTGRVVSIQLDENGEATLEIPTDKLYAPQGGQAGLGRATRVEFEGWYKNGEIQSSPGVVVNATAGDDSGSVGASGNDYRTVTFQNAGDWVGGTLSIPTPGKYQVTVAFKSNEKTGLSGIGTGDEPIGDVVDMSDAGIYAVNRIFTQSIEVEFAEAGDQLIKIFCMGKGSNSSSSLSLRIDYIEFTPVYSEDPQLMEAEAENMTATGDTALQQTDAAGASGGSLVSVSGATGGSTVTLPIQVSRPGAMQLTLQYQTDPAGPILRITDSDGLLDVTVDTYGASAGIATADLGEVTFQAAGEKELYLTVGGFNKSNKADSYSYGIDALQIVSSPGVTASQNGAVLTVGDTLDLSEIITPSHMLSSYMTPGSLRWQVYSETAFDVAEVDAAGQLTANSVGTAVLRVSNQYAPTAYVDYTVTVLPDDAPAAVKEAAEAIASLGAATATEEFKAALTEAENLYKALRENEQQQVTSGYLLTAARVSYDNLVSQDPGEGLQAVNYLEDLDYTGQGTFTEGTCPSGSHKIQFAKDGEIYEHGMGFEPPDGYDGALLVPIPEGVDTFYAKVGIDWAMSQNNEYDQLNYLTFYIDGEQMAQTGQLKSNYVDGQWVDTNIYDVEIEIPDGAKWLYIENFIGNHRNCDHILLADAQFKSDAAANVEALIREIAPDNVNLEHWSEETAEKIRTAEAAYIALTPEERALVSNFDALVSHRRTHAGFGRLELSEDQLAQVDAVDAAIGAVQTAGRRGVSTVALAEAAKEAFDGLGATLQDYVSDVFRLYEAQWWIEDNAADLEAAEPVYDQIAALPETVSESDRPAVEAARAAYNNLTSAQQALVDNLDVLVAAEEQLGGGEPVRGDGDYNGNGVVDIQDVMSACRVLARSHAGTVPTKEELAAVDMDGDKDVDIQDIMLICRVIAAKNQ
ncbi:MAG TPA: NPCBM/NEW2 domain-containing protein [Firmicutes bacterium]|nr:NPCBM/NEW2 domain-containing protein [Bacillota bacterium]